MKTNMIFQNKNGNEYRILATMGEVAIIVKQDETVQPYIVVRNIVKQRGDLYEWDCGKYFDDINKAIQYFDEIVAIRGKEK
ncbi:MAG: hypothetical protein RSA23_09645 [Carnobacterium sp.]